MSHLTRETLSQIADEGADPRAQAHLEECPVCRRELDAMRDLTAGLRALPEPPVPPAVWSGVVRRLVSEGRVGAPAGRSRFRAPLQAAAAVAMLALGFGAGRITSAPGPADPRARASTPEEALAQVERTGDAYRQAVADLQSFEEVSDPEQRARLAAERLAALDLLAEASRAALEVAPEDPVVNGYLYTALQERQRLMASFAGSSATPDGVFWR